MINGQKVSFTAEAFKENLHEIRDDGTVILPVLRTSILKEDHHFEEVTKFAQQHLDKVLKIQKLARRYVAKKLLTQKMHHGLQSDKHSRYFSSAEYFEYAIDMLKRIP